MSSVSRRRFLFAAASSMALSGCESFGWRAPEKGPLAAVFPEGIDDGGFAQAGYSGLLRVRDELGIPIEHREIAAADEQAATEALRNFAESDATMVVAFGERLSGPGLSIAAEFPNKAITLVQSESTSPAVAVYRVLHEQSAWLAGAAAGLLTRRGVVGHVGGARTAAALRARSAFAAGLASVNSRAKLQTNFSDAPNNPAAAERIVLAEHGAGADVLYVSYDVIHGSLIETCRRRGIKLIGDQRDWISEAPDVFVASALADPGVAMFEAGRDLHDALWKSGTIRRIGVANKRAVSLALAQATPEDVRERLELHRREIAAGAIKIPTAHNGPEFS